MGNKTYIDWTYNSKNPLRRFAHRTRFKTSLNFINHDKEIKLLDYGCGDGLFLNQVRTQSEKTVLDLKGYEPYMESISQNNVEIYKDWGEILEHTTSKGKFNYVTCFEVMEHFNPSRQIEALDNIADVLDASGNLIISVPIEKGLPSVIKNIIRRVNHPHDKHVYNFKNIYSSFRKVPLPKYRTSDDYLLHMGFYFDDLEKIFEDKFVIKAKTFSPFNNLGYNFNSQVFYHLNLKR